MSFTIAGFHTTDDDYRKVAALTVPTWKARSGADVIEVVPYESVRTPSYTCRRFQNIAQRSRLMVDVVKRAVEDRRRLLLLDIEAFACRDLAAGFHDTKPWSVTRWPRVSLAVLFLNTDQDWPFVEFFEAFAKLSYERAMAASRGSDTQATPGNAAIAELLKPHRDDVHNLPADQWNYCDRSRTTREDILERMGTLRIYQIVYNAFQSGDHIEKHVKTVFPEILV